MLFKLLPNTFKLRDIITIQNNDPPKVIEEKLKSFLSPARRAAMKEEGGEDFG
jgi:chemotaxis protein MotA